MQGSPLARRRGCRGTLPGWSGWLPRTIWRRIFILPSLNGLMEKNIPTCGSRCSAACNPSTLHRRDADLAIRMVKPESGNLTLKRLGKVGFGLYSADTGQAGSTDIAFNHAHYIGWPESHQHLPAARWITRTLRGRPCRVEANTLLAQLSAVSAGPGLGVLPHFMARKKMACSA